MFLSGLERVGVLRRIRFVLRCCILSFIIVLGGREAPAVVVDGPELERPPGVWVGKWRSSTAVPIGSRFVMTAAHVGGSVGNTFRMDGVSYPAIAVYPHPSADLLIIELASDLPGWNKLATSLYAGQNVLLGGRGFATGTPLPNGYLWSEATRESWGRNVITFFTPDLIEIVFDPSTPVIASEGIFAQRDSGGGLFVLEDTGLPTSMQDPVSGSGPIGGITFPQGTRAFADQVIRYLPNYSGGAAPTDTRFTDPNAIRGIPDYNSSSLTGAVSLGDGGLLEVAFRDNMLTNSGDDGLQDLHIYEVGAAEPMYVSIRPSADTLQKLGPEHDLNGDGYFELGRFPGGIFGIDIDQFFPDFEAGTLRFLAVQLIDEPGGDVITTTIGGDIDAIGAISSVPAPPSDNQEYRLAGIAISSNSPNGASLFGDRAYALNVIQRADFIRGVMDPTCTGDVTRDQRVNLEDLNLVLGNLNRHTDQGDANSDGFVNFADATIVIGNFNIVCDDTTPCDRDINRDNTVSPVDLDYVAYFIGTLGPIGDVNNDNFVDVDDYTEVLGSLGEICTE